MKLASKYLPGVALLALAITQAQFCRADEPICETHGTAVNFVASPAEAAQVAKRKEKLVFVLHVSGLFENPDYT